MIRNGHSQESSRLKDLAVGSVDAGVAVAGVDHLCASLPIEAGSAPRRRDGCQIRECACKKLVKSSSQTDRHSKSLFGRDRHDAPFWQGSVKHKSHLERMEGSISPEK